MYLYIIKKEIRQLEEIQMEMKPIRLTAAEIGNLWTNYINDSMAICVIKHFLNQVEDDEIRPILEYALHLAKQHVQSVKEIFNQEKIPIPIGFTDDDVNVNAPRLFSDTFYLIYLQNMSRVGLAAYSLALPGVARPDARNFYNECINSSTELNNQLTEVMLNKGIYSRSAFITYPEKVDFINHNQGYLAGWFGNRRPLNAMEITQIHFCLLTNFFSKVLMTASAQVAQSKEVRQYMERGKHISSKHIEVFQSLLKEEDLSIPPTWDSEVSDSTVPPFSDKLMMFHSRSLTMAGIGNYGTGLSTTMRHDLGAHYARLAAELGHFGDDGANIMIKNAWLEQPPSADDRNALARKK
jgi:spore coat protein CotF